MENIFSVMARIADVNGAELIDNGAELSVIFGRFNFFVIDYGGGIIVSIAKDKEYVYRGHFNNDPDAAESLFAEYQELCAVAA